MSGYKEKIAEMKKKCNIGESSVVTEKKTAVPRYKQMIADAKKKYVIDVDENYINSFLKDVGQFFTQTDTDSKTLGYGNAAQLYDTKKKSVADFQQRAKAISNFIEQNKGKLKQEDYDSLTASMKSIGEGLSQVSKGYLDAKQYYGQWATEEDYNAAVKAYEREQGYLKYDTSAGEAELAALKNRITVEIPRQMQEWGAKIRSTKDRNLQRQYQAEISRLEEELYKLEDEYDDLKEYISNAKEYKVAHTRSEEAITMTNVAVAGTANYDSNAQHYIDIGRAEHETIMNTPVKSVGPSGHVYQVSRKFDETKYMNEDEKQAYFYYLGRDKENGVTSGNLLNQTKTPLADAYYKAIEDQLNDREGSEMFKYLEDKPALQYLFGIYAGLDQFGSSIRSLFNTEGEYVAPSEVQYASKKVRDKLGENGAFGQAVYDIVTTGANMAPSLLTAAAVGMISKTAGGYVGSTLLGASAGGNAYQQFLNQGYGKDKALAYGLMVGVSEATLEKVLSGISAFGGTSEFIEKAMTKAVSGIDNALLRFSLKYGGQLAGKIGAEAIEEGLQSVLEPVFQRAILDNNAQVDWEEVAYDALLGGAMGGLFGSFDIGAEMKADYKTSARYQNITIGQAAKSQENFKAELEGVIQEAMKLPETAEAHHLAVAAQKKIAAGKELSAAEVGALYRETAMQVTKTDDTSHQEAVQQGKPVNNAQSSDGESRRLTDADIDDYMRVGDRLHVRNTKQRIVDNGESPILTKPEQIVSFIRNAFQRKIQKTVKGYGRVNNRLANAVKVATNGQLNIDDYYLELDADKIAHISDHIVQDKDSRNIPLDMEQLERLPDYIDNYDDLIDVIQRKDGSVRLMLGKKINGHTIIVETVSKGRESLHPVTAYQIDSADYQKKYKTRAIDRSSTSRPANADTVDISRPAIAPAIPTIASTEQIVNNEGGNQNGQATGNQPVGAADLSAGQGNIGRAAVSDGEQGWLFGQRSGQQAGGVDGSSGNGQAGSVHRGELGTSQSGNHETIEGGSKLSYIKQRQRLAATLRLERVSGQSIGVAEAVEEKNVRVLPTEYWDAELQQIATEVQQETGLPVTFILGKIKIRTKTGKTMGVRGVISENSVIIQADNFNVTPKQIAEHELFHEFVKSTRAMEVVRRLATRIMENHSQEELEMILDTYKDRLMGIVDPEGMTEAEFVEAYTEAVWEELLADAYAGINAFGVKAERYRETVRNGVAVMDSGRRRREENGTKATNGPNSQAIEKGKTKYSTDEQKSTEKLVPWDKLSYQELNQAQFEGRYDNDTKMVRTNVYDGVNMAEDGEIYSYDFLTSLPDMNTVILPDVTDIRNTSDNRIDTYSVVEQGIKNARTVGTERDGKVFVRNVYTGRILRVDRQSIRHGLNGDIKRLLTNARLGAVVGNVVQNAVPINALHNKAEGVTGTYAMAGYATDSDGREFVAIVTVEQRDENISGVEVYDVAHAVSGRQKNRSERVDTKSQGVYPSTNASKISIAVFLDIVNSTHQSILSEDVLERLGEQRKPGGYYTGQVKFSVDDTSAMEQELERLEDEEYQRELMESGGAAAVAQNQKRIDALKWQMRRDPETIQKKAERELQTEGSEPAEVRVPKTEKTRKKKPVSESKPVLAKQGLRKQLLDFFSIPDGQRAELGKTIDGFADRLLKKGALTDEDRSRFFDRLYQSGVMEVPADDIYSAGREALRGGRIYVSDKIRSEFGDDWNDFRRQAFGAGIYLTSNRSDSGVDQVNSYMAEMLPVLFDADETDMRLALERIVQVAEEGKSQNISLPEYTAELAGREHVPEREFLDAMERQMDWMLRTFAEKAELEIKLRDRTGVKIAQEREAAAQSRYKQAAKEEARRLKERQNRQELREQQRERKNLKELQQKTLKQLQWLSKNRYRAPEELKATWDEVLGDIDLFAVSAAKEMRWSDKHNATWRDLADMYQEAKEKNPNFLPSKELERIVSRLNDKKIADMDVGALQELYRAAVGLQQEFYHRNNVINDETNRMFEEVYEDSKREIEAASGRYKGKFLDNLFNLKQLTPMNVLQRMGGWDPDGAFFSMAKQLERGERDMRAYVVKANRMLEDFLKEHKDWVKKCDGQGKDGIWYELEVPELLELGKGDKPIFGDTIIIYMTPAQKVHMYLESKNVDNLRHMVGGRTFADKKLYSEGKRQEALAQGRTIRLAPETVKEIVSKLTEEEKAMADVLEKYYNQFATGEINRVSNVLYGYDKAMGKNYAPIYTNQNYTKAELGVFDATAEGVGHMKGRVPYSKNPSYNISALDAFERHVEQTARFCGMSIPARNWQTLLNWREKNNSTGDVITHKWGDEGKRYIEELIENLQAGTSKKAEAGSEMAEKILSNYISAVFGGNPSIVLKQLGSIPMAAPYLDFINFPKPAQIKNIDRELIAKYTQDLAWRTMGYSTPETKQLKDNPNWTQTNEAVKFFIGGGAITAMDGWAASVLWPWAENKVMRDFPELTSGTDAYYQKVAELFENAMSRSQSVSDEIHQSSLRKSKSLFTRAFTMFRSDSAQAYNAIRQKIGEAKYYENAGADKQTQRKAKKAAGTAMLSAMGGFVWAECIRLLVNLWIHKGEDYRDDEGELTAGSVIGEMAQNLLTSMAGTVVYGEEIAGVIGNIITGEKFYDIETPGMEQFNRILNAIMDAGGGIREIVVDAHEVYQNGGDVEEYFRRHGNDILGEIKKMAETAAQYFPGLPVKNVETYLLGLVKWVSPELATAYEDLFATAEKDGLSGLTGGALETRVADILHVRKLSESADVAEALAGLYEEGHTGAVPGNAPSKVTIDKDERELGPYQKQVYENIWGSHVAGVLGDVVCSEVFGAADAETQSKMLSALYSYAGDMAKAELFEDYEIPESVTTMGAAIKTGLPMVQILEMKVTGANLQDFVELTENEVSPEKAYELTMELDTLEPEGDKERVADLQKYMEVAGTVWSDEMKDAALETMMPETSYKKYKTALNAGITTYWYFQFLNNIKDAKSDDRSTKKEKVVKEIHRMDFTRKQKDTLYLLQGYVESGLKDTPWH